MSLTHSRVRVAVPVLALAIVAGLLVYRAGMSRRAAATPEGVIIASGTVELTFSGDAAIRRDVDYVEARLADLGAAWETTSRPHHQN